MSLRWDGGTNGTVKRIIRELYISNDGRYTFSAFEKTRDDALHILRMMVIALR